MQRVNNTAYANSLGFLSRADAVAQGLPENMMDYFFVFDNLSLCLYALWTSQDL